METDTGSVLSIENNGDSNLLEEEKYSKPIASASSDNQQYQVVPVRSVCSYGGSCYRKNPQHRVEEAHPGDEDYRDPAAGEEEGERPECEFGTECYRTNPMHKKQFSHSKKPQPKREAKAKKKKNTAADDYDSDDSFINDEEDGWEPVDDSDDDADFTVPSSELSDY